MDIFNLLIWWGGLLVEYLKVLNESVLSLGLPVVGFREFSLSA